MIFVLFIYELFHDHDRLLFAWGQSEFLVFAKTAAMLCKSCHVAFLAPACQVT